MKSEPGISERPTLDDLKVQQRRLRQNVPFPVIVAGLLGLVGLRLLMGQTPTALTNFAVIAVVGLCIGLLLFALRQTGANAAKIDQLQAAIEDLEREAADQEDRAV